MKPFYFAVLTTILLASGACSKAQSNSTKDEKAAKPVIVIMETSKGTVEIELNAAKAPITVKNFLGYVDDKFYDGTIFHRVIPDFMVQSGGFLPKLKEKKTKATIKNEAGNGLSNVRGTIAMARTDDPDSASAQFYISVADNSRGLDKSEENAGYCVFGKVLKGMDILDEISKVETHTVTREVEIEGKKYKVPTKDVPVKDVVIKSIRRKAEASSK